MLPRHCSFLVVCDPAICLVSNLKACKQEPLERKLYPGMAPSGEPKVDLGADQYSRFEDMHFADQMAVDKLKVRRWLQGLAHVARKQIATGTRE